MGKGFMEFICHLYRFFISLSSMAVFLHTTERGSLKTARKVHANEWRPQSPRTFTAPTLPCLRAQPKPPY